MSKISYEDVVERFTSKGHTLLTPIEDYQNTHQKLKFKCGYCREITTMTAKDCRKSKGYCSSCGSTLKHLKYDHKNIFDYFKSQNCTLLTSEEDYINTHQKLEYFCNCGNQESDFKSFKKFKEGQRCAKCKKERTEKTCEKLYEGVGFASKKLNKKGKKTTLSEHGSENFNNREQCKKTNLERYGYENALVAPDIREKTKKTMQERYGVDYYTTHKDFQHKANTTRIKNPNKTCSRYSKESQILFWQVYDLLPPEYRSKCYFGELNKEYNIFYNERIFAYDFVISSLKKCIEYNGSAFHPKPELSSEETGWFPFNKDLTAGEKRKEDSLKIDALKFSRDYDTLVIWDYEENKMSKILEFLK